MGDKMSERNQFEEPIGEEDECCVCRVRPSRGENGLCDLCFDDELAYRREAAADDAADLAGDIEAGR